MVFGLVIADRDDEWVTLNVTVEDKGEVALLGLSLPLGALDGGSCLGHISIIGRKDLNRSGVFKLRMPTAVFDAALLGVKEKR